MIDDDDNDDDNTFLSKCYQTPKVIVYINYLQFLHTPIRILFLKTVKIKCTQNL